MDNPPAFPLRARDDGSVFERSQEGMSLRDWFAGQALVGIVTNALGKGAHANSETFAFGAYEIADAMLAQRTSDGEGAYE